jgi:hypothetical protein
MALGGVFGQRKIDVMQQSDQAPQVCVFAFTLCDIAHDSFGLEGVVHKVRLGTRTAKQLQRFGSGQHERSPFRAVFVRKHAGLIFIPELVK